MRNWLPSYRHTQATPTPRARILKASPPAVLAMGFLALIGAGTLLLWLPVSQREPFGLFPAFFTATSAVTVTGLSIIDPGTQLTAFGQLVLMMLIQLGGLGFVTFAVISAITLGKRISLHQQALALQVFDQTSVTKIQSTAFGILKLSLFVELVAGACLAVWWSRDMPWTQAAFQAVFHTVSAFNNAGFALYADSLGRFTTDGVSLVIICLCIISGGLGFTVISDLWRKRAWAGLLPYTKIILAATAVLNILGLLLFWWLEHNNPATLAALSPADGLLNAWFYSVTSRTAGFATLDITAFHDSTTLLIMVLMFIGGASLSTAGGIKIGTCVVLLSAVWSFVRHRPEVVLFQRSVSPDTVQKALALLLVTVFMMLGGVFIILVIEQERVPFLDVLFEVISALATTGLTRNTTAILSEPSQAVLTLLMFAGRLGPLTLVYSIATQKRSRIRYPEAEFQVG